MEEVLGTLGGSGFLAALILPRGVEDGVMLAAVAPEVDFVRAGGR